jgi:tetratricopeptide (TPR) repeat protein
MRRASAMLLAIVLGLMSGVADPARADQNDPRLEALFRELRVVTGYLKARTLEQQIWSIWSASSNPEVNRLMDDGVTAMATQDYKTALADFTRVIEAAPDFAEGWNKRATVLWLVGDYEGSLADVDKTLALEPRHFGALAGLGHIYAALERDDEALAAYERALAVNPHMPGIIASIEQLKQRLRDKEI